MKFKNNPARAFLEPNIKNDKLSIVLHYGEHLRWKV